MGINSRKISVKDFGFFYGSTKVLESISMDIEENSITAIIGPSGCGKSTFLRTFNKMNDLIANTLESLDRLASRYHR